MLGVHVSVPATTLKEFVDYAKARPGQLNYASGGNGTIGHLSGALFVSRADLTMTHVPYKGGAPAVADLVAGRRADVLRQRLGRPIQHSRSGKIRLLGVSSETACAAAPGGSGDRRDLPGLPHPHVEWPARAGGDAAGGRAESRRGSAQGGRAIPRSAERLVNIGVDPLGSTPAEFAEAIRTDSVIWQDAIKAAGMTRE